MGNYYSNDEDIPKYSIGTKGPKVIVVDGIIGAGKSTIIKLIVERLNESGVNARIIPEPVDNWLKEYDHNGEKKSLLQLFYNDKERWGYHFQTQTFIDRIEKCREIYTKYKDSTDIFVMERSILSDRLFMNILNGDGFVSELEMANYTSFFKMWKELMPFTPDAYIYIRPDLNVCMERIAKRARKSEDLIPEEYLKSLLKQHDIFFDYKDINCGNKEINDSYGNIDYSSLLYSGQSGATSPSLILSTNVDFVHNQDDIMLIIREFIEC